MNAWPAVGTTLVLILLSESLILTEATCKHRPEAIEEGRKCRKPCTSDADCKGSLKRCRCDNACGMTCFNPVGECAEPAPIENGRMFTNTLLYGGKVIYSCNRGFVLKGRYKKRFCRADKKWGGPAPTCERGCISPGIVGQAFADTSKSEFSPGESVDYTCLAGRYLEGDRSRRCVPESGGWSPVTFICRLQTCEVLPDKENGHITYTDDTNFGSTAKLTCNKGYQAETPRTTVQCYAGSTNSRRGVWSGSLPSCRIIGCPAPTPPRSGSVDDHGLRWEYRSQITYACDFGFSMRGQNEGFCNENGTWGAAPQCIVRPNCAFENTLEPTCGYGNPGNKWSLRFAVAERRYFVAANQFNSRLVSPTFPDDWSENSICVKFEYRLVNADIKVESAPSGSATYWKPHAQEKKGAWLDTAITVQSDSEFKYQITASSGTVNVDNIVVSPEACHDHCRLRPCQNGGTCVNRISGYTCFCTVDFEGDQCQHDRKCSRPTKILNGNLVLPLPHLLLPETEIQYQCRKNYKFSGYIGVVTTKTISCVRNGLYSRWDPPPWRISCIEITCGFHPNRNVHAKYPQSVWKVGDVVTFECQKGYEFSEEFATTPTATCGSDETWSAPSPHCKKVRCPMVQVDYMLDGTHPNEYGDSVSVRCKRGFEIHGHARLLCQADKTWNHAIPTCELQPNCSFDNPQQPTCGYSNPENRWSLERSPTTGGNAVRARERESCLVSPIFPSDWSGDFVCIMFQYKLVVGDLSVQSVPSNAETYWRNHEKEVRNRWEDIAVTVEFFPEFRYQLSVSGGLVYIDNIVVLPETCENHCGLHPCQNGGTCQNRISHFVCFCTVDFEGQQCQHDRKCQQPPTNITNGNLMLSTSDLLLPGTRIYYSCRKNHKFPDEEGIVTTKRISCYRNQLHSQWLPLPSQIGCKEITCEFRPNANVRAKYPQQSWKVGDEVVFECFNGYEFSGEFKETAACGEDERWSAPSPDCKKVRCPRIQVYNMAGSAYPNEYGDEVTVWCKHGFEIHGDAILRCQANKTWNHAIPTCERVSCPTISFENSRRTYNGYYGDEVEIECQPGYEVHGSRNLSCLASRSWSSQLPTCQRIRCGTLQIDNMVPVNQSKYFEDEVSITCIEGHELHGVSTLTCEWNGDWIPNHPTCERVKCATPTEVQHALNASRTQYVYEDTHTYTCKEGYRISGMNEMVCGSNGHWSHSPPSCTLITCPHPQVPHGYTTFTGNRSVWLPENIANFSCVPGYRLNGTAAVQCQADGAWDSKIPTCTRIECQELGILNMEPIEPPKYFEDNVTIECMPGFELFGAVHLICQYDGTWSPELPRCKRVKCGVPADVLHARNISRGKYRYEDHFQYVCDEGYRISGKNEMVCGRDGQWSHAPPNCTLITCPQPQLIDGYVTLLENNSLWLPETTANFSCFSGYEVNGTTEATCQSDGEWNPEIPTCSKIQCEEISIDKMEPIEQPRYYKDNIIIQCIPGYNVKGAEHLTCQENGSWFPASSTRCKRVKCPGLGDIENAEPVGDRSFKFEDTFSYTCKQGYRIVGETVLKCTSNGKWSGAEPICTLITCPHPNISHGYILPSNNQTWLPGDNSTFFCHPGYEYLGVRQSHCLSNGSWDREVGTCSKITCPMFEISETVIVRPENIEWTPGNDANFSCTVGYELSGSRITSCLSNGSWSDTPPNCSMIECATPPMVHHAQTSQQSRHVYKDTYTYKCDEGYKISGNNWMVCGGDGQWSHSPPSCTLITCDHPLLIHGDVQTLESSSVWLPGSIANLSCMPGYTLNGTKTASCQKDGTWEPGMPTCSKISCPTFELSNTVVVQPQNEHWIAGDNATFSCIHGHELTGPQLISCQIDGSWSDTAPNCSTREIRCGLVPQITHGLPQAEETQGLLGQTYTYPGCAKPYEMLGNRHITCEENGWTTPPECKERPPTASFTYEGYEYLLYLDDEIRSNYSEAQGFCKSIGGNLAVIYSEDVRNKLESVLNDRRVTGADSRLYIGLQRQSGVGWRWDTGVMPLQKNRITLQPSTRNWWNHLRIIYSTECGTIERSSCWSQGCYYFWTNEYCHRARSFICQRPRRPTQIATYDGHEYMLYLEDDVKSNYTGAKKFCKSIGGNLPVFYEYTVKFNLARMLNVRQYSHIYVGLQRRDQIWRWDTDMISYQFDRLPRQPYSRNLANHNGACGTIARYCSEPSCRYYWQSEYCHNKRSFICQRRVRCSKIQVKNMFDPAYPNEYGDAVNIRCEHGFELHGNGAVHCQADRTWNQPMPTCQRVTCSPPLYPLYNSRQRKSTYKFDEEVYVRVSSCRNAWGRIRCTSNGEWTWPLC